ncbi:hypothetical protein GBAR_LOCUS16384, partial [Geodia barretti]
GNTPDARRSPGATEQLEPFAKSYIATPAITSHLLQTEIHKYRPKNSS